MFSVYHIIWLVICFVWVSVLVYAAYRRKCSLKQVLTSACVIAFFSELLKMIDTIQLVPSTNGSLLLPYLPLNHLPLHFCSIQILFILYTRFSDNEENKTRLLKFMYPTCVVGAIMALLMPSIYQTTIRPDQSFTSLIAYQFYLYHASLLALGLIIARSKELTFTKKDMISTILTVYVFGILSIYVNSILASPTYVDGKLVSVDFWTNFFFTTQNPLGIPITAIWQWWLYIVIIMILSALAVVICYIPFLKKKRN